MVCFFCPNFQDCSIHVFDSWKGHATTRYKQMTHPDASVLSINYLSIRGGGGALKFVVGAVKVQRSRGYSSQKKNPEN